jgi:hypothetical protein
MNENENTNNTETTGEAESTTETVSTESTTETLADNAGAVVEEAKEVVEVVTEEVTETASVAAVATEEAVTPTEESQSESADALKEKLIAAVTAAMSWVKRWRYSIIAAFLVVVAVIGMLYILEERGRIHTGMFDGVKQFASTYKSVAKVNGKSISEAELNTSVSQLTANAEAQGVDVTAEETIAEIRSQSLDMLINTELLKQEAAKREIAITDEDVDKRITTLTEDVGGEEVLKERMMQFGIDNKTLRRDVKNELTIQALLDQVFSEKGIVVSEEEIKEFYDQAGGAKAGLPKIEEVRDQIEVQIKQSKQQEVVTAFIEEVKAGATIEII